MSLDHVARFNLLVFCWGYLHLYSWEIQVSLNELGSIFLLFYFLKVFYSIAIISPLNVGWIHQWSQLDLLFSLWEVFKLQIQFFKYIEEYLSYLFLLEWALKICAFQGICLFSVSDQIHWHKVGHNFPLQSFNFYRSMILSPLF